MNSCIYVGKGANKTVDRSIPRGECINLFRAAIKSPSTRDAYERRLISFLKMVKLTPDSFIRLTKKDPCSTERKIISTAKCCSLDQHSNNN